MRDFSRTICAAIVAALALTGSALAQTLPGPEVHELKQLWRDANGIAEDAESIRLRSTYCKPPNQPTKAEPQAAIDALRQQLQALRKKHTQLKKTFDDALGKGEIAESTRAAYPKLDGMEAADLQTSGTYWAHSNAILTNAQKAIDEKQNALNRAPVRDCSPTPPKTEEEIIGGNPPPVEPPPPPPPPPPPVDPLKGLTRPPIRGVKFPRLENHYCSQAEKDAVLALFPPEIAKVNANIADVDAYIASLNTRRGELKARGVEQHWLDSMDYEIRQAETEKASHRTSIPSLETTRRLVESTPVVDCTKEGKKEVGWLPGSTGTSVEVAAAAGDLTIPKKPYLSIEGGGNQYLGVVDHERTATVAALLIGLTYDIGFLPEIKFGDIRRNVWRAFGEVSSYDYDVHSSGASISTTTESVGIPGTGDLTAMYPAGVFFANPAFNDVTGIAYGHTSDFQGLSFGLEQKSSYDCGTVSLGAGLSLTRLETSDTLSGRVDGFLTDFRYRTGIETRNTSLFVRGGLEVPLDHMWDQSLRYAGEFTGFRVAAGVEAGVNFLDAEGLDRLDLTGFVSDAQSIRIGKDDTTFSYKLGLSLNYAPPGARGLDMSLGFEYGQSDTHPTATRSGQTGDITRIDFDKQEAATGILRTRFTF